MRTKNIAMILTLALKAGLCQTAAPSQAATPKLSAKKLTIKIGKTAALKVKKTSKKAKWSIVSGKKNIRLTAKKKTSVKKSSCHWKRWKKLCVRLKRVKSQEWLSQTNSYISIFRILIHRQ